MSTPPGGAMIEPHQSKPGAFILHVEISGQTIDALREWARRTFPADMQPGPAGAAALLLSGLHVALRTDPEEPGNT